MIQKSLTHARETIRRRCEEKQNCCQTELFQFHNSDNYSEHADYSDYYVYGDSDYSISIM